ncbi:MAG: hypothetical protein GY719_23340 [bacterium]|nr:hypothetical protein [bacterium]
MELPAGFLRGWCESWRYPSIWIARCRERKQGSTSLTSEGARRSLIEHHAMPASAEQVFAEILERGEFDATSELLQHEPFQSALSPESSLGALEEDLQTRRQETAESLEASWQLAWGRAKRLRLSTTARELGLVSEQVPEWSELEALNSSSAGAARQELMDFREKLAHLERQLTEALGERIREARETADGSFPEERLAAAERSLEQGNDEVAEYLLYPPAVIELTEVPDIERAPSWFWGMSDSHAAIAQQLLGGTTASPGAVDHWAPPSGDRWGPLLLRRLQLLLEVQAEDASSAFAVFCQALTGFLFGEAVEAPEVELRDGFFSSRLEAASSPWLPALAARHGRDLPIAMPDPAAGTPSNLDDLRNLVLVFDPRESVSLPRGALPVTPDLLFRLMPRPGKRAIFFYSEIGYRIPFDQALPRKLPVASAIGRSVPESDRLAERYLVRGGPREITFTTAIRLVSTFLKILGLEREQLERMIFYANGRADFLREILRGILSRMPHRSRFGCRLTERLIEETWADPQLQQRLVELVLSPLERLLVPRLVLGSLLFDYSTSSREPGPFSADIQSTLDAIGIWTEELQDPQCIKEALTDLERLGILQQVSDEMFRFAARGLERLILRTLSPDLEAYIGRAVEELKAENTGTTS